MAISHKHTPFQYSDYISPLPAEELIRVGTIKQQLYNEGVAKVQNQIDTLDEYGFSILKEEDKKYFSQEMDKFMKAINEGAAKTDFANINSLRDLLSVGRPLENDPLILNAIQSTQEAQRRQKVLAGLSPKERNAANDYDFMKDYYDYMNDGKVGSKLSFGKEYIPYVDPTEYLSNILDKVKGDIRTEIIRNNGLLEERVIEELTNEELKQWMETSLPANIKQQVRLDAAYTTQGVPQDQMLDYYLMTRYNQYEQTLGMVELYRNNLPYLDEEGIEDFKKLVRRAQVLQENITNAPNTPEEAYDSWINDHYNAYITGQSDFYAIKKVKSEVKADPLSSLAKYESRLRKQRAFYENAAQGTEETEGTSVTPTPATPGTPETPKTKKEIKEEAAAAKKALNEQIATATVVNKWFEKITNNLTKSKSFENVQVNKLDEEDAAALKEALKAALVIYSKKPGSKVKYDSIPGDINLSKVQVRKDGEDYIFRVDTGKDDVVYEVWQDVLDEAIRETQGLEDVDFQFSIDTRMQRNARSVNEKGVPVNSNLTPSTTLTPEKLDNTYKGVFNMVKNPYKQRNK